MSRHDISRERWLAAWQAFDELYVPSPKDVQDLIRQYAVPLEQAYGTLDDVEEREQLVGQLYGQAKRHGLPLSLVDWWRELQVGWVDGEDNDSRTPDALPQQHQRFQRHYTGTLRLFRQALADNDQQDAAFLACMLDAIRLAEGQRLITQI